MTIMCVILKTKSKVHIKYLQSLIYSKRKEFLERAAIELVYKFDEKSYRDCLKW